MDSRFMDNIEWIKSKAQELWQDAVQTAAQKHENNSTKSYEEPDSAYPGDEPTVPPSEGWVWRGPDAPGGERGAWYNPETGETLKLDLDHEGSIGAH